MKVLKRHVKQGFSLIEVLIFVSILGIFFVNAAFVVTATLQKTQAAEHKVIATRYADELLMWLRNDREKDWSSFVSRARTSTYCFNTTPIKDYVDDCNNKLAKKYTRKVLISSSSNQKVDISITVEWQELGSTLSIPLNTSFTIWEE